MSFPLPILERKLKEARALYPEVERSMRLRAQLLQRSIAKGNAPPGVAQDYMQRIKHTQWRCRVRVTNTATEVHALMWWTHGPQGHHHRALDAILLRGHEKPLHFDRHFWSWWGLRSELMGVLLTNVMGYFNQYTYVKLYQGGRFYPEQPEYAAAIAQGLVLGRTNGKRLVSCDTFKNHGLLSANERKLWKKLSRKEGVRKAV